MMVVFVGGGAKYPHKYTINPPWPRIIITITNTSTSTHQCARLSEDLHDSGGKSWEIIENVFVILSEFESSYLPIPTSHVLSSDGEYVIIISSVGVPA